MKVLFLSLVSLTQNNSAQLHRLKKLGQGLNELGIETALISLLDMPVHRPTLLFPLNLPFAWSKIQGFDFIHAISETAYTARLWKPATQATVVYDVDADSLAEARMHRERQKGLQSAFWVFQATIMNRIAYKSKDYFVTVSEPLKKRLITEKGVPQERLHIVRNGVDTKLFQPTFEKANDIFTICYAGAFQAWQGIDNLVSAGQLLKGLPIKIKIIGFTSADSELKAKISAALGDMVELIDRVPQSELTTHLAKAHFLIIPRLPHPAVEIAFPTKFSEYLAMGKPVIVSNVDETANFVQKSKCGLVSEPNPQALAEIIRQAASLSTIELVEMGRNGRHLAETVFDWQVVCRHYAELLRQWHNKREV